MKEYNGVVREIGASNINAADHGLATYAYVEVGDAMVRKLKATTGIRGKLGVAFDEGKPVTLYVDSGYLCGIKMADGRVYASEVHGFFGTLIFFVCFLLIGIPFSVIIIGIPFLWMAWVFWGRLAAHFAAKSLPGALLV